MRSDFANSLLFRRVTRISRMRPAPPRSVSYDQDTGVLSWDEPKDTRNVTHYRIRLSTDILPEYITLPVGTTRYPLQFNGTIWISSFNSPANKESNRILCDTTMSTVILPPGDVTPISAEVTLNGRKASVLVTYDPPDPIGTLIGLNVQTEYPVGADPTPQGSPDYNGNADGAGSERYGTFMLEFDREDVDTTARVWMPSRSASFDNQVDPEATPYLDVVIDGILLDPAEDVVVEVVTSDRAGVAWGQFDIGWTPITSPDYWYMRVERIRCDATYTPLEGHTWELVGGPENPNEETIGWPLPHDEEFWLFRCLPVDRSDRYTAVGATEVQVHVPSYIPTPVSDLIVWNVAGECPDYNTDPNTGIQWGIVQLEWTASPNAETIEVWFCWKETEPDPSEYTHEWTAVNSAGVVNGWFQRPETGAKLWIGVSTTNRYYPGHPGEENWVVFSLTFNGWHYVAPIVNPVVTVVTETRGGVLVGRFDVSWDSFTDPEYWYMRVERIWCDSSFTPVSGAHWEFVGDITYAHETGPGYWWTVPKNNEYWKFRLLPVNQSGKPNYDSALTVNVTVTGSTGLDLAESRSTSRGRGVAVRSGQIVIAYDLALSNPGFEDQGKDWTEQGTVVYDSSTKYSGTYAARVPGNGGNNWVLQKQPAVPGQAYRASAYVRNATNAACNAAVVDFWDEAGNDLLAVYTNQCAADSTWRLVSNVGVAPANTAFVSIAPIVTLSGQTSGYAWADQCTLEQVTPMEAGMAGPAGLATSAPNVYTNKIIGAQTYAILVTWTPQTVTPQVTSWALYYSEDNFSTKRPLGGHISVGQGRYQDPNPGLRPNSAVNYKVRAYPVSQDGVEGTAYSEASGTIAVGADSTLQLSMFSTTSGHRPMAIVTSKPTLPDSTYPAGLMVLNTGVSPWKLWRINSTGTDWERGVGAEGIQGTIAADVGYLGSLNVGQINAGLLNGFSLSVNLNGITSSIQNELFGGAYWGLLVTNNSSGGKGGYGPNSIQFLSSAGGVYAEYSTTGIAISNTALTYYPIAIYNSSGNAVVTLKNYSGNTALSFTASNGILSLPLSGSYIMINGYKVLGNRRAAIGNPDGTLASATAKITQIISVLGISGGHGLTND